MYTMEGDFAISWESGQVALVLFSNQGSALVVFRFQGRMAAGPWSLLVPRAGCHAPVPFSS